MLSNGNIGRKPKLILHFDIRNTVLVADSATHVTVEQGLNNYMTSVSWGTLDGTTGLWDWIYQNDTKTVSLKKPSKDAISYYKYLEASLVKKPEDRLTFRRTTGDFTETATGSCLRELFSEHLECLKIKATDNAPMSLKGYNGDEYHYLLPSFLSLISFLIDKGRDFVVIFDTFGNDSSGVLTACERYLNTNHSNFHCSVKKQPMQFIRYDDAIDLKTDAGNVISHPAYILGHLNSLETGSFNAIVGDFRHWLNHNYHYSAGKPLFIDQTNESVLHIMFDDNFRAGEPNSIIDLRMRTADSDTFHPVEAVDVHKWEDMFMVQVDLLKAIKNKKYYTDQVIQCEDNYRKMLAK